MANLTITSTNAVYALAVTGVFSTPVPLAGFAADEIFSTDQVVPAETSMGIDGHLSAGFTPHVVKQKIHISPDSASVALFEQWFLASQSNQDVYYASATITFPGTKKSYNLKNGVLTGIKLIPDAKKTLQPHEIEITWESITLNPTT